jgi:hypothetical protein
LIEEEKLYMHLFATCTQISLGNGQTANFWKNWWLNRTAPAETAPLLFQMSKRKFISVAQALSNGRWMRGLARISNDEELHQFLSLGPRSTRCS